MERSLSAGRDPRLPAGIWISVLRLEQQDAQDLAFRHLRNAHRHRPHDGNVSFFAGDDCPQRGGVWAGAVSRKGQTDHFKSADSCFIRSHNRFCSLPKLPLRKAVTIISPKREWARHASGPDP